MLVGQTLCTNGSEYFRRDWHNHIDKKATSCEKKRGSMKGTINMLNKVKSSINTGIDEIKK